MTPAKKGKGSKAPKFKKSHLVYSVVGAACCNSGFRKQLFSLDSEDDEEVRKFLERFVANSGGNAQVTDDDVEKIETFVAPRTIGVKTKKTKKAKKTTTKDEVSFEIACQTFALQVCPFWPCDDY